MRFGRSPGARARAAVPACLAAALLAGCATAPDTGPANGTVASAAANGAASDGATTERLPTGRSSDLPYDQYEPPSSPPGLPGLPGFPGFPELGPLDPHDPSGDRARSVLERHRHEIEAIPGWQGDGISRRNGHTVIIVMTRRPIPPEDRIDALDGVPLVYVVAGPFLTQ